MGVMDRLLGRTADAGARLAVLDERATVRMHYATDGRDMLNNDPDGWEVEQPWLWWTGPPPGTDDPASTIWGNPPPGADAALGAARSLGAVSRCTSIICDTIAGLPWQVVRGTDDLGAPPWVTDPQSRRVDGRVNPAGAAGALDDWRMTAVEFWSQWIRSALWYGDGFVYVPQRAADGSPQPPLWQLHPDSVRIDGEQSPRYVVDTDSGPVELDPNSVLHLRGGNVRGKHYGRGTGVLTQHAAELGLALSTRGYAGSQYRNGIPAGYLKSTAPKTDEPKARALQEAWMTQHGNAGRRKIAVLNATTEFVPINLSPLDAQLDNARQWSLRDIALAFGVPPYMLGAPGDSATYANVESRMIELRQFTLLPWIRRIESVLDAEFALGTSIKVKAAGLERADTATRYAAHEIALRAGFMTVDEVRALEDLPPLGVNPRDASDSFGGPGSADDQDETDAPADDDNAPPSTLAPVPDQSAEGAA